jgi:hypothetical protein
VRSSTALAYIFAMLLDYSIILSRSWMALTLTTDSIELLTVMDGSLLWIDHSLVDESLLFRSLFCHDAADVAIFVLRASRFRVI